MNITEVLTYLSEELKDIPANADNIHSTNLPALISILKSGKIKPNYYETNTGSKNEIATARSTKSNIKKDELSPKIDNVKISLYSNRILAGVRGARKTPIAEYPKGYMESGARLKKYVNEHGIKSFPNFPEYLFKDYKLENSERGIFCKGEKHVRNWLKKHYNFETEDLFNDIAISISAYFRKKYLMKDAVVKREHEERFSAKDGIPVDPKFMKVEITGLPSNDYYSIYYDIEKYPEKERDVYLLSKIIDNCKEAISVLKNSNVVVKDENYKNLLAYLKKCKEKADRMIIKPRNILQLMRDK